MASSERPGPSVVSQSVDDRNERILAMAQSLADIGDPGSGPEGHDNSVLMLKTAVEMRELVKASREDQAVPDGVGNGE